MSLLLQTPDLCFEGMGLDDDDAVLPKRNSLVDSVSFGETNAALLPCLLMNCG